MRMFKKVLAGFVAAAMVATMAGCGSSNSSTKDSGSDKAAAAVAAANLDHDVYIIGVDGSNDMRDNIKDGKALATALQQIDKITRNAVTQANDYLTNGTTGLEEKQLVDCVVITKDNADKLDNFVFAE